MDKRLIVITTILFASVLLVSGLMNSDSPAPNIGVADNGTVEDGPAPEEQSSEFGSGNNSDDLPKNESRMEEKEELPALRMSGGSAPKLSGSTSSAPEEEEKKEEEKKEEEKEEEEQGEEKEEEEEQEEEKEREGESYPGESIPEFPTIALPMLAIIGLAFFFRRK
ncbi:MAG: PEF-CTERM sorting domain-containing protein [Methanolobus sp.]|nr:PEF-CTERM sorting domain-containing protein [Methanolobus sp.]